MNRRNFLKNFTFLSSALCVPTFLVRSIQAVKAQGLAGGTLNADRILVVVEFAGGCDGLNTVVPYTNDFYYSKRPGLGIAPGSVLPLDGNYGLHPAMTDFKDLFDDGRLAVLHGVGYPNPNRSHFRSRDIWHTAEPIEIGKNGWLAKYFDANQAAGTLQGINVGGPVPKAMISENGSSPAIQSIDTYQLETDPFYPGDESNKNAAFQQVLGQPQSKYDLQQYVSETALAATVTSVELLEGQQNYNSTIVYPGGAFATNLQTISKIIAADLGVQVFYVTIGGFDTHAEQVQAGSNTTGTHAQLLQTVSQGLRAFYDDMKEMGVDEQVLIMSFSEFGRRLGQNASDGTDHGTANQMFFLGTPVMAGLHGTHPSLAPDALDPVGDMVFSTDFRSAYATALTSWLGADHVPIIGEEFPLLDVVQG